MDDFLILEIEFPDKWQNLNKKLEYPYEFFNNLDVYEKPVDKLQKEDFFSKLKINVLRLMKQHEQKKFLIYLIIKMERI